MTKSLNVIEEADRKEDQTAYAVWSFLSVFAGKMVKVDSQTSRLEDRSAMLKMNDYV